MKQGRSLQELATELERQRDAKRDYVADTRKVRLMFADAEQEHSKPRLSIEQVGDFAVLPHAHRQIAQRLNIPAAYYDRMLSDAPALLAGNVNHWLSTAAELRMVRTMDGNARAFLSNRYRRLDNADLAEATLPALIDAGCHIASCDVTESRLYIKALTTRLEGEVAKGDAVQGGVVIQNSEIGQGALSVSTFLFRLVCLNGMVRDEGIRRAHLGRHVEESADLYSDRTLDLDDKALFAKVVDTTKALLSIESFQRHLGQLQAATQGPQMAAPAQAVTLLGKRLALNESETQGVLAMLIRGGDLSKWGLANAVTALANDAASYDRATELEAMGSSVIELAPSDWRVLAEAA